MLASAVHLGLVVPGAARLAEITVRTIRAAGEGEHRIRIVLTAGVGSLASTHREPCRVIVMVEPLPPRPHVIALAIVDHPVAARPNGSQTYQSGHKKLAYLDHLVALELARAVGADEAVRLDPAGRVVEGSTSNLFVVDGDRLVTPPISRGALPGIVRRRILELGAGVEADLTVDELRAADEIFITSSLRGVVAVTSLDGEPRDAGPTTAKLAAAYDAWMCLPISTDDAAPA
jgi:branched-chain amino acid aminotransferase